MIAALSAAPSRALDRPPAMPASALPLVLSAFCAVMPTLSILAANLMPAVLACAALLALLARWRDARGAEGRPLRWPSGRPAPALLWAAALLLWAAMASLWTFDVGDALFLVFRLGLLALAGALLLALAAGLTAEQRQGLARWLAVGFAIGLAVFVFERLSGNALHALLGEPDPRRSPLSQLNRGATGLALLVWPVTALLLRGPLGRWALLLPAALLALLLAYESRSAIVAVALGLVVLPLALRSAEAGRWLARALLLTSLLAAPPVAKLIQGAEALGPTWVDHSAQQRLLIWNYVADRIFERPLFGWGFDASHAMPGEDGAEGRNPVPAHPHNVGLQIWLELGLVGIALSLGFLLAVLRGLDRLAPPDRAAATALFACGLCIASVSYGIWQSQWIAAMLGAALAMLALRDPAPRPAGTPEPAGRRPAAAP